MRQYWTLGVYLVHPGPPRYDTCRKRVTLALDLPLHHHSHISTGQRISPTSVVQVSFPSIQHIAMLTVNGSTMGEHVWVEESGVCGGE